MKFLSALLIGALIYFSYSKGGFLIGTIVTLLLIIYGIYKYMPDIYRIKGKKAFSEADYKSAKAMYQKAVKTGRANTDILMEYSYILLRTGDVDEAAQVANNVLCHRIKPEFRGRAVIQRCMCYYKQGNLEEALADATELYDDGYRSIMLYGMLGYFKLLQSPDSDETFDFCKEAYDYADDDRDICDNMLICYYNRGEYEKAKEISDTVLEKSPKFVEAWYHAAQIDDKLGLYEDALEKIRKTDECNRSFMTTIPEDDVVKLKEEIENKMRG